MAVALRITGGNGAGSLLPIGDGLLVGRDAPPPGNHLTDPGISAHLRPAGDATAILQDLGGTGPIEVNGQALAGPTLVRVGDRIRLGATTLEVEQAVGVDATRDIVTTPPAAPVGPAGGASVPLPAWQQLGAYRTGSPDRRGRGVLAALVVVILVGAAFAGGFLTGGRPTHAASATGTSPGTVDQPPGACRPADSGRSGAGHFRFNTSACENGTLDVTAFTLPIHKGTSNGMTVWYVIMDTSDRATSARLGVNFAPKLANAVGTRAVQAVTVGADGTVNFPGTVDFHHQRVLKPGPAGFPPAPGAQPPAVGDGKYSPLIALPGGIVENAPQIANVTGQAEKVITLNTSKMTVVFRAQHGFYENKSVHYASFDASDATVATIEDVTFAPNLNAAPKANDEDIKTSAREQLVAFLNGPADPGSILDQGVNFALLTGGDNPTPLNLLHETPVLADHADVGSPDYSPMWDVHFAVWTQAAIDAGDRTQYRDVDTVLDNLVASVDGAPPLVTGPGGKPYGAAGVIVNCPLVSIDIP